MKHILILLLLLSFSAFAYNENPYRDQKRWEAEERFDNPENFNSGRDAHYWDRQHDRYEEQRRRDEDLEEHTQKWLDM